MFHLHVVLDLNYALHFPITINNKLKSYENNKLTLFDDIKCVCINS